MSILLSNPILRSAAKYALPDLTLQNGGGEASYRELCRTFDGYYYNTIFEELGPTGFDIVADMDIEDIRPRGLKNPAKIIVDFYEEHALTGRMIDPPPTTRQMVAGADPEDMPDGDLWVQAVDPRMVGPVMQVWDWSNFQKNLSQISRNAGNYGNCLLVATEEPDPGGQGGKVYVEIRHPAELVAFERHPGRGHLIYAKIETLLYERDPITQERRPYVLTREYTKTTISIFKDGKPFDFYGTGEASFPNPHGFVPVVLARFQEITGEDLGLNAYYSGLSEINEICLTASTVGTNIAKHNSPQWAALGATPPTGKPLERGDNIWYFPAGTALQQIIAKLDIAGAYLHIDSLMDTLENKFPELLLPKIGDSKRDITGAAVRGILSGLIRRGLRVREGLEVSIVDIINMAVSMGQNFGGTGRNIWQADVPAFGTAERKFFFHWPDILPYNRLELLKIQNDEKALELAIFNLQMQSAEARRKAGIAERLVDAPVDPVTGFPIDPQTLLPTDPATLMPFIPQPPPQNSNAPGTVGPGSQGAEGANGQPKQGGQ